MNRHRRDRGGPVIAVCAGQRCRTLPDRADPDASIEALKSAVAQTKAGVLISTGCLGRCHLGAVVVMVWRGNIGCEPLPLAGMEAPTAPAPHRTLFRQQSCGRHEADGDE